MTESKKWSDRQWMMFQHASGLFCFVLPLIGNVLAAYLIWKKKRDEKPLFYEHGLEVVNFQLTMTIYFSISIFLLIIWVGIFLMITLCVFQLLVIGLAVLKAHDLEVYKYPLNLRLLKDEREE